MITRPRNVCCDVDYFMTNVVIYFSALSDERYQTMCSDDKDFIREVHLHLRTCSLCLEGYEHMKLLPFDEDVREGKPPQEMLAENERHLKALL